MSTIELVEHLKRLSNAERLEVIEVATRLVREQLDSGNSDMRVQQDRRWIAAAERIKDLYEPGGELTESSALDAEEFADDYLQG